eukprot:m51a1_g2485 hypothetical protein (164) ;mRNA; f:84118-84609
MEHTRALEEDQLRELAHIDRLLSGLDGSDESGGGRTGGSGTGTSPQQPEPASDAQRDVDWTPATDLLETDDALVIKMELPGIVRDAVDVEVGDSVVTVSGTREVPHTTGPSTAGSQRPSGRFARSFSVPRGVGPQHVSASLQLGVLELRVAKPAHTVRTIPIL